MTTRMTLGKRLALSFASILFILVMLASLSIRTTWVVRAALDPVGRDYLPLMALATDTERNVLNARIFFIYFATIQKEGTEEKGWVRFRQAQEDVAKLQTLVRNSPRLAELSAGVDELSEAVRAYEPVLRQVMDAAERRDTKSPQYAALVTTWANLGARMVGAAGQLNKRSTGMTSSAAADSSLSLRNNSIVSIVLSAIGLAAGLLLAYFVAHSAGAALRSIAGELRGGAGEVSSAAGQVASSSQSLAQGASEQAASLNATSASTEEITSMTRTNAEKSQSAADLMSTVDRHIKEGNRTLEQMVVSMQEINASSGKISKIIKVIDEIAFQTNILALNAAVEAARAGEAGMGFAVVADEVRNLAQRSAQAARDTADLIEESIAKSNDGSAKLQRVAEVMSAITGSSSTVKTLVDEVNLGSQEQARGTEQIAQAVAQMDQVTHSMAASAEESASAGEELSAQAETLNHLVSQLQALVGGATREVPS